MFDIAESRPASPCRVGHRVWSETCESTAASSAPRLAVQLTSYLDPDHSALAWFGRPAPCAVVDQSHIDSPTLSYVPKDLSTEAEAFVRPSLLFSRSEILNRPCPIPATAGVYGWWFRRLPTTMDVTGCRGFNGHILLYTGISPRRPPANGRRPSAQSLRTRIVTHYTGNAEGSTLRKTLGCLLAGELGIALRRVGSGRRMTFLTGEQRLSAWMGENARVAWVARPKPWELEDYLISNLDVPLNLDGNVRNAFHPSLSAIRAAAVARARELPVIANPGVGGR